MTTHQSSDHRKFADRHDAGAVLATHLWQFAGRTEVVVLALPRGGVPVGYEVARALKAPLDVFIVRKLGVPGHAELAMGALASGGINVFNEGVLKWFRVPRATLEAVTRNELLELQRRERAYRGDRPLVAVAGRLVIVVDDGLATGSSMRAAVLAVRRLQPARIVVAVPVGARDTCDALREIADDVVCASMPNHLTAVGLWYEDFSQTTDDEVRHLLAAHSAEQDLRRSA